MFVQGKHYVLQRTSTNHLPTVLNPMNANNRPCYKKNDLRPIIIANEPLLSIVTIFAEMANIVTPWEHAYVLENILNMLKKFSAHYIRRKLTHLA